MLMFLMVGFEENFKNADDKKLVIPTYYYQFVGKILKMLMRWRL